jgi:hypothetical protein
MGFAEVQDAVGEILIVVTRESRNVEVQWTNIEECVLDTMNDLLGKVERRTRKAIDYTGNDQ